MITVTLPLSGLDLGTMYTNKVEKDRSFLKISWEHSVFDEPVDFGDFA